MFGLLKRIAAAAMVLTSVAAAAAYPDRPVTIVVPYAAGGSTDVLARILGEAISKDLGQPVVVENAGGGGGTIGTSRAVRAQADGYTVLLHNMGIATAPTLYENLSFDVTRDLMPIAMVGDVPMILVGNKNFAPSTLAELLAVMKQKPDSVNFSHAGVGATSYLCAVLLTQMTGTRATLVPYRGTGPALQDLVAGNVDLLCDQPVATGPHLKSGALKPYAVATDRQLSFMPDVPTFREAGLADFELAVWHGIYAPKDTPAEVVARLNQAVRNALSAPDVRERFSGMGVLLPEGNDLTSQALGKRLEAEVKRWRTVLTEAGVKPN